ncbi:MAG: glycoside hydrolase family 3 N-terminal domain-containing protein [Lachnospiraceae bacterium]|nr:glycoside hydrolase family 3 N-terminal domain-containing protein [Lachnospiraceae bacterium]
MNYKNKNLSAKERTRDLLGRMTLEEKAAQLGSYWVYQLSEGKHLSGKIAKEYLKDGLGQVTRISGSSSMKPDEAAAFANEVQHFLVEETRLGIPAIVHEEACAGFNAIGATIFPQALGMASGFEPELNHKIGEAIRKQMRAAGAHHALAPVLDISRDPRWGRIEETYGEDPYLASQMGMAYIRGLQGDLADGGVMATGKHFVGYGAPEGGMNWAPAHIGQRELREIYLLPFEAAVKEAGLKSIMNGYHELDGVPCGASKELLTDILKKQWGFEGLVVSDYFAINQIFDYHHMAENKIEAAKMALEAGMDVELPNVDCFGAPLLEGVRSDDIDEKLIDQSVAKILELKFQLGLFENPYVDTAVVLDQFDKAEDREIAREAAVKSMVLLKNEDSILPLRKDMAQVAVIGPCGDNTRYLMGDYTYQGQFEGLIELNETKSSNMDQPIPENLAIESNTVAMNSILTAVKNAVSPETQVFYAQGCTIKDEDESMLDEAVAAAKKAQAAIVCVGDQSGITMKCTTGESCDRSQLTLPGIQEKLIRKIVETGVPVILVLTNGRPYSLVWEDANVAAILEAWLPGEEGADAIADILFGDAVPGGKLAVTFPRNSGQIPTFYMHKKSGGRSHWRGDYDDEVSAPLYPFGYGLSYTIFGYENFAIDKDTANIGDALEVSVDVVNTGNCAGDEVVQLYIYDEAASVTRPVRELKGFKRLHLKAGEKKKVRFSLSTVQMGFYGPDLCYQVEAGKIEIMIGSSSEEIRCKGEIMLKGETQNLEEKKIFSTPVVVEEE